jgi:AcrR family transcriptional regulator
MTSRNQLQLREDSVTTNEKAQGNGRRRSTAEQRKRLLRAGARLFAKNGYHATGVAELGRAVALGRGALYHHMGSKQELLVEISVRHVREMVAVGEEVLGSDLTPPDKLRVLSRRLMRTISENLPEVTVFFREGHALRGKSRRRVIELRDRFDQIWQQVLDEGVDHGYFRHSTTPVRLGLLGMHNYSYVWIDPNGRMQPEQIADAFCDIALFGLLTETSAGHAQSSLATAAVDG